GRGVHQRHGEFQVRTVWTVEARQCADGLLWAEPVGVGPEDTDRSGRELARERRGEVAVPLPRVDRHERAPGLGLRGVLLPQERLLVDDRRRLDDRAVDRQPQWTD